MTTSARNTFLARVSGKVSDTVSAKILLATLTTPSTWTSLITKTSATKFAIGKTVYGMANPVDVWLAK